MVYIDENKLTIQTLMCIGQELGIEGDCSTVETIKDYVNKVVDILREQTWKKEEEDWIRHLEIVNKLED